MAPRPIIRCSAAFTPGKVVWLPHSTAVHRHLVLEEAWQILLSPATASLIQRLLKNSRKAALSLDVLMHTLSDLGEGRARDLARLCEIAHVGRLGPEEAAAVGTLLGLPPWAVDAIPSLDPGQAVWKVGPGYVDIVQTLLDSEEAALTDTSTRRRRAQGTDIEDVAAVEDDAHDVAAVEDAEQPAPAAPAAPTTAHENGEQEEDQPAPVDQEDDQDQDGAAESEQPQPGIVLPDDRHRSVLQAAAEGRFSEAADLAAIGERDDITTHGITSDQAALWLVTRAHVAELRKDHDQVARLRATFTSMGKEIEWYEQQPTTAPAWHQTADPQPAPAAPASADPAAPPRRRRRTWPYLVAAAALALALVGVHRTAERQQHAQEQQAKAAAHKGYAAADITIDGVTTETSGDWARDGTSVIVSAWVHPKEDPTLVRVEAAGQKAEEKINPAPDAVILPTLVHVEVSVPIDDRSESVKAKFSVSGPNAKPDARPAVRTIEFRPDGTAVDAESGERLTGKKQTTSVS